MLDNKIRMSAKRMAVRDRIISAATDAFRESGFTATTISLIASKAKIADGTVYLYFEKKEDLLMAVIEKAVDKLIEHIDDKLSSISNPIEKILKFIDINIKSFMDNPQITRMIVIDLHKMDSINLTPEEFPAYFKYTEYIKGICSDAVEKEFIRKVDAETLAMMIFACIDYMIRIWVYSDATIDIMSIKDKMLNVFVYGIAKY